MREPRRSTVRLVQNASLFVCRHYAAWGLIFDDARRAKQKRKREKTKLEISLYEQQTFHDFIDIDCELILSGAEVISAFHQCHLRLDVLKNFFSLATRSMQLACAMRAISHHDNRENCEHRRCLLYDPVVHVDWFCADCFSIYIE